jgi:hypothetical protein
MNTIYEDVGTSMIISFLIFLKMRNVSDKMVEKIKVHILCSKMFLDNGAVYDIMRKNIVKSGRAQMIIKCGACAVHAG